MPTDRTEPPDTLRDVLDSLPRLWWCPAWGTLSAVQFHGNDGPDDPNCGKTAYVRDADLRAAARNVVLVEDPPQGTDDEPSTANGRDLLAHSVQYNPADADRRVTAAKIIAVEREARGDAPTPEPPLGPACADVRCSWQPVAHVHEGDEVYAAGPDDPAWFVALATSEEAPHD